MDKNTFGDSKAAIILAEKLAEVGRRKDNKRVTRILNDFGYALNKCSKMEDKHQKIMYNLVYDGIKDRVDRALVDDDIKSFTMTVVKTMWKKHHREQGIGEPPAPDLEDER